MRRGRLQRLRGRRSAFAVIAIYALVLQAIFGGAAMSASLALGADGHGIICRGDAGHGVADQDRAQKELGRNCVCQGLCPQHGAAGIDLAGGGMGQLRLQYRASALAERPEIAIPAPRHIRPASSARAPPGFGSHFA
jgi:hypothetical protein